MFNRNSNKGFVITDIVVVVVVCSILLGTAARLFMATNSAKNGNLLDENGGAVVESAIENGENDKSYTASKDNAGKYNKITEVIPMKKNMGKIETEGDDFVYGGDFSFLR